MNENNSIEITAAPHGIILTEEGGRDSRPLSGIEASLARGSIQRIDGWSHLPDDQVSDLLQDVGLRPSAYRDGEKACREAKRRFANLCRYLPTLVARRLEHARMLSMSRRDMESAARFAAITFAPEPTKSVFQPAGWLTDIAMSGQDPVALLTSEVGEMVDMRHRFGVAWAPLHAVRAVALSRQRWKGSAYRLAWRLDCFGLWADAGSNLRVGGFEAWQAGSGRNHHYLWTELTEASPGANDPGKLAGKNMDLHGQALDCLAELEIAGAGHGCAPEWAWPRLLLGCRPGAHAQEIAATTALVDDLVAWVERALKYDGDVFGPVETIRPIFAVLRAARQAGLRDGRAGLEPEDLRILLGDDAAVALLLDFRESQVLESEDLEWLPADYYAPGAAPEARQRVVSFGPELMGRAENPLLSRVQVKPVVRRQGGYDMDSTLTGRVGRTIVEMGRPQR